MKGSDIFCASQAATAICLSTEEASSSSSSTIQLGLGTAGRVIDRYNPIIRDSKRIGKSLAPCNSQQPPISPKPRKKQQKKNQKNSSEENADEEKKKFMKPNEDNNNNNNDDNSNSISIRKSWSCTKPGDFISPASSTRYLLSDKAFLGGLPDSDPSLKSIPREQSKLSEDKETDELSDAKPPPQEQVVVLGVTLDCRGCEKKLKKHLSKMEGITSFDIDFVGKKVTVIGNVTSLSVLESITKMRNAKSWSPVLLDSGNSLLKKDNIGWE